MGGLDARRQLIDTLVIVQAIYDPGGGGRLTSCSSASFQKTFGQRLYQQYTCYTVFFVSIEICQISDVLIRKTRRLSVFQQGFFRSALTNVLLMDAVAGCLHSQRSIGSASKLAYFDKIKHEGVASVFTQ
ncbi:unnamed protein product [Lota lota]